MSRNLIPFTKKFKKNCKYLAARVIFGNFLGGLRDFQFLNFYSRKRNKISRHLNYHWPKTQDRISFLKVDIPFFPRICISYITRKKYFRSYFFGQYGTYIPNYILHSNKELF